MQNGKLVLLSPDFYESNKQSNPEMNTKQNRMYMYLKINYKNLTFLIPLETNVFSRQQSAFYPLPTQSRPNAGLNFRKALISEQPSKDIKTIEIPLIPRTQLDNLTQSTDKIERNFTRYIENFIQACNKNREHLEKEFKFSTLHFYKNILL